MNDTVMYPPAQRPSAARPARTAMNEAAAELKRSGNLATLISSFLFCLVVTFAWVTVMQLLAVLMERAAFTVTSQPLLTALEWGYGLLLAVLFALCAAPVWLGRLRLAGRVAMGEQPLVKEVLYYFTSVRRFGRAVLTALIVALQVMLPLTVLVGGAVGVFYLYNEVLLFTVSDGIAILLMLFGVLLLILLAPVLLLLSGFWLSFAAIAVGNEELSVLKALGLALRTGKRNLIPQFLFTLRALRHLFLSAVTIGVLYLFWYSHHYLVSYVRLSVALCAKKESD